MILNKIIRWLFVFDLVLGLAHCLWPQYHWGQGRASYFNLAHSLTLASWFLSVQLASISILSWIFVMRSHLIRQSLSRKGLLLSLGMITLIFSIAEITRFHQRLSIFVVPGANNHYELFIYLASSVIFLTLFMLLLKSIFQNNNKAYQLAQCFLLFWAAEVFIRVIFPNIDGFMDRWRIHYTWVVGMFHLIGVTFLLAATGQYFINPSKEPTSSKNYSKPIRMKWLYYGIAGTTFILFFLQVLLFRMLVIFGDHLKAHSIISIALFGIAYGALIAWKYSANNSKKLMALSSMLLPWAILLSFGACVVYPELFWLHSFMLMIPFICCSCIITVALIQATSRIIYFIDLAGAAAGALFVGYAFTLFREEGSFLFLIISALVVSVCFILQLSNFALKRRCFALTILSAFLVLGCVYTQQSSDWLNVVRVKLLAQYPKGQIIHSKSSYVGRYDVLRKKKSNNFFSSYENGKVIDTVRPLTEEDYEIDPRVPSPLFKNPSILIIGLSGDGITKTSKLISNDVVGIELNPATAHIQGVEMSQLNANSYEGIDVQVMDGRTYLNLTDRKFEMITLLNTHTKFGRTQGAASNPEYLFTQEAVSSYLDHLSDQGVVNIEEPVNKPIRELPVWKLLRTMRQTLLDRGVKNPEKHFYIFQWQTHKNTYIQILMKKTPFLPDELVRLEKWLWSIDHLLDIESDEGRRLGPARAKTTLYHSPDLFTESLYSLSVRGMLNEDVIERYNLQILTDDKPFYFDIDPKRPKVKESLLQTLLMALFFLPFLISFMRRQKKNRPTMFGHLFVVGLTGLGYLWFEVVLIQKFSIFLGSPTLTFTTVLGTLLFFSGLGSLWSGRLKDASFGACLGGIVLIALAYLYFLPGFFSLFASGSLGVRILLSIVVLVPQAFLMGVPFPYVLRLAKKEFSDESAGMLFAINAVMSAIAVPLALNYLTQLGFSVTFIVFILIYLLIGFLVMTAQQYYLRKFRIGIALALILTLFAFPLISGGNNLPEGNSDFYKVFTFSYGNSSMKKSRLFDGGSSFDKKKTNWMFWLIKNDKRTVLVDTGFSDPYLVYRWGIKDYEHPVNMLKQIGVEPSEVDDVILTHAHWDHMGTLAYYDQANIWIQKSEYEFMKQSLSLEKPQSHGMLWNDLMVLEEAQEQGRLHLVQGQHVLDSMIKMTLGGAHTQGSQYVKVQTQDGPVIVSGDATYMYDNNRKKIPIGTTVNKEKNLEAILQMQKESISSYFILPGHDPKVFRKFPKIASGIVQITSSGKIES